VNVFTENISSGCEKLLLGLLFEKKGWESAVGAYSAELHVECESQTVQEQESNNFGVI
jgi:hypothetical protein